MATINEYGNVTARCPGCEGSTSTFEWRSTETGEHGKVMRDTQWMPGNSTFGNVTFRLFRCAGCGLGGMGKVIYYGAAYPGSTRVLEDFEPEIGETLRIPEVVPMGIKNEFREAEDCLANGCLRAAAGMFRSVLDKTLRANGYKSKPGTNLEQQIDAASADGIITEARRRRAHDEVRVLGNDVLHDEWREIPHADVEAAHHYVQRILEDFYDERPSTLKVLREKKRVPDEDKPPPAGSEAATE